MQRLKKAEAGLDAAESFCRGACWGRLLHPTTPIGSQIPVSQKARKIPKSTRFEDAIAELESIVQTLEQGEQSLEESLEQFERGVSLSRFCQDSLNHAEQKVKILLKNDNGEEELETLDKPEPSNSSEIFP